MVKRKWKKIMAAFLAAGLAVAGGSYGNAAGSSLKEGSCAKAAEGGLYGAGSIGRCVTARIPEPEKEEDQEKESGAEAGADAREEAGNTGFRAAKDYREILDALRGGNRFFSGGLNYFYAVDSVENAEMMDSASADSGLPGTAAPGSTASGLPDSSGAVESAKVDYSDTNVQVEGIAEADIVKTDGEYIYILSKRQKALKIFIVRAKDGELALESSFSPDHSLDGWREEMYVSGNRLVVVRCGRKPQEKARDGYDLDRWSWYYGERQTEVLVYDITDRKAPFLAGSHVQDGDYVSSREKDGCLYVVSEKGVSYSYIQPINRIWGVDVDIPEADGSVDGNRKEAVLGKAGEMAGTAGQESAAREDGLSAQELASLPFLDGGPIAPDCIYFRGECGDSVFTVVTAIRLETPKEPADAISFMTGSGHCYMSGNAVYLAAYDWFQDEGDSDGTEIVKISYADGKLGLAAQGKVKGSLDDQFSMDEKDGYLRVVTTVEEYRTVQEKEGAFRSYLGRSNALYVLDPELAVVGFLEGLAKDERIYSARFIGDIAYFVTFRNTDPLFSVDLSDPAHPVLLGALKIPGFSDYLHPYGEDLLLGIGYDADETGAVGCVKLTMFDIHDPLAVTEKHTLVLDGYGSSEACDNHRAVLVDEGKNLIGLPFEGYFYGGYGYQDYTEEKGFAVYGYDEEKGFYQKFEKGYVRKWDWKYYYDEPEVSFDAADGTVPKEVEKEPVEDTQAGWTAQSGEETLGNVVEDAQAEREGKDGKMLVQGDWNDWYNMRLRGIYIGDYFYLVNQVEEVCSYRMGQDAFLETTGMKLR